MASISLPFAFCTSSTAKIVQVRGSWDDYSCPHNLAQDKNEGEWKGVVQFSITAEHLPGFVQIYWYEYIVDGIIFHDEQKPRILEPVSRRYLNRLSVPCGLGNASTSEALSSSNIAKSIPLPPQKIQMPKPVSPGLARTIGSMILTEDCKQFNSHGLF